MIDPPSPIVDDPTVPESIREAVSVARNIRRAPVDLDNARARLQTAMTEKTGPFARVPGYSLLAALTIGGLFAAHEIAKRPTPSSMVPSEIASQASPLPTAPASPSSPRAESTAPTIAVGDLPLVSPQIAQAGAHPRPSASAPAKTRPSADQPGSDFEEEMAHLGELRTLATTDPAATLVAAESGHTRFRKGIFYPEREAIAIEALKRLGRSREAETRARHFIAAFPHGPFTERVRSGLDVRDPERTSDPR